MARCTRFRFRNSLTERHIPQFPSPASPLVSVSRTRIFLCNRSETMKRLSIVVILVFSASFSTAQTGFPLWGSFETSGFDTVNRQNLNANFSIPLVSAPSRGSGFNYALVYDSLIWTKTGTAWTPVNDASGAATWGWKDNLMLGAIKYLKTTEICDSQ